MAKYEYLHTNISLGTGKETKLQSIFLCLVQLFPKFLLRKKQPKTKRAENTQFLHRFFHALLGKKEYII
jgi:hypothetical protein